VIQHTRYRRNATRGEGSPFPSKGSDERGVSEEVLSRTIIIEFGSAEAVFEAMTAAGFLQVDKWVPLREAGDAFH
jgi:hypothetical protein